MTDITKCLDHDCPLRWCCYRYRAPMSEYQSVFAESPRKGDDCEEWLPMRSEA